MASKILRVPGKLTRIPPIAASQQTGRALHNRLGCPPYLNWRTPWRNREITPEKEEFMATTSTATRVTRLILVPSLITLAVTILRVYAELHHWGKPWVYNGVGGGPTLIAIAWLAPIFGIYFALKLTAMGAGPASIGKTIGFTLLGIVVFVAGSFTAFGGHINTARVLLGLVLMAIGALLVLPVWRELFKVLIAYAYAARIPVAIVMYFAMRGN